MPLILGKSKEAFNKNVGKEMHAGKPQKQALAIAYNVMRKNRKKMADGGSVSLDPGKVDRFTKGFKSAFAEGGEAEGPGMSRDPKQIAIVIRSKRMAKGGMAEDDDTTGVEPVSFSAHGGKMGCYAEGGDVYDEDSDSEVESLPMSDEDKVGVPELGYDSAREDTEGMHDRAMEEDSGEPSDDDSLDSMGSDRKGIIKKIMRGLHSRHMAR